MDINVFVRTVLLDHVVKQILTIASLNHAETMEFVMIQLLVILVIVHLVILVSHAKQISTIVNLHHVTAAPVLMEIILLDANAILDTLANFVKFKQMNANQVCDLFIPWRKSIVFNCLIFNIYLDPCLFGGHCENLVGGYRCRCKPGTSGKNCEVNVNECHSS